MPFLFTSLFGVVEEATPPTFEFSGEDGTLTPSGNFTYDLDWSYAQRYTTGLAGKIVGGRLWCDTVTYPNGRTVNGYLGFYADNAGSPGALLGQVAISIPDATPEAWQEWELAPGDYIDVLDTDIVWVAFIFDDTIIFRNVPTPNIQHGGIWGSPDSNFGGTEEYANGLDSPFDTVNGFTTSGAVAMAMKIWTNP